MSIPLTAREHPLMPVKPDDAAIIIGDLYRKACASQVDAVNYYIEAGRALIEKKAELSHGEWLPWLAANADVLGFASKRTAQLLMKQAANTKLTSHLDEALQISRTMWGNAGNQRTLGTGENEWYTPKEYIEAVRDVFGTIDLDPASSAAAQKIVPAKKYFSKKDNGLGQEWRGRVWLNPPYSQPDIAHFVAKLLGEIEAGRVTAAIMLTHNNTDTAWFHDAAARADAVCFTKGRVKFESPEGDIAAATNGQTFFYFGSGARKFGVRFRQIGLVLARMMD